MGVLGLLFVAGIIGVCIWLYSNRETLMKENGPQELLESTKTAVSGYFTKTGLPQEARAATSAIKPVSQTSIASGGSATPIGAVAAAQHSTPPAPSGSMRSTVTAIPALSESSSSRAPPSQSLSPTPPASSPVRLVRRKTSQSDEDSRRRQTSTYLRPDLNQRSKMMPPK